MTIPTNHIQLVEEAQKRICNYKKEQEQQNRTDDDFTFSKIGEGVLSEATKVRLRRLEELQRKENETVYVDKVIMSDKDSLT
jgi:hypothetical protein